MIKRMFFIVFSCLLPLILFSQNNTIKGLTTDENAEPLIGVNIVVKGKTIGTVSDVQGNYIINAQPGEILVFSYIGYQSIEVPITQNVINVILKEDVTYLDEVVAIGYGSQKRSNVTNAISTIKGEDLISRGTGSADEALIGKVAGVRVMQMDGMPGRGMDIKVRGISSINFSNNPLYVIDGFPVDNLRSVTTGDIESIEVLKDAASTAIYGSRGSQGVILITTKRGAKGKPVVQLNTDLIVQRPWSKINVLNRDEWIEFAIEERNNTYELNGGDRNNDNSKRAAAYQIDPLWLTDPTSLPDHDWYDITTRNALMQKYQLSVSGATDDVKYYISSNWLDQPGVVLYTDFNRLSFTSNVEGSIKDFLSIGVNLNASQEEQNDPQTSSNAAGVSRIQLTPPVIGLEQNTENGGYYPYAGSFIINPLAQLRDETRFHKTRKIRANVYADVKFTSEFKLRSSFGAYLNNSTTQQYIMAFHLKSK
jgi:TonB-linked SusC/RagA family outer membrane protein